MNVFKNELMKYNYFCNYFNKHHHCFLTNNCYVYSFNFLLFL